VRYSTVAKGKIMSEKFNYTDFGELEIKGCDDANIPVNCFIYEPENENEMWKWTASNFMPRKGYSGDCMYEIKAPTKEDILKVLQKYVVPLYEIALDNIKNTGKNYYWQKA
jgi:hypothetical protein